MSLIAWQPSSGFRPPHCALLLRRRCCCRRPRCLCRQAARRLRPSPGIASVASCVAHRGRGAQYAGPYLGVASCRCRLRRTWRLLPLSRRATPHNAAAQCARAHGPHAPAGRLGVAPARRDVLAGREVAAGPRAGAWQLSPRRTHVCQSCVPASISVGGAPTTAWRAVARRSDTPLWGRPTVSDAAASGSAAVQCSAAAASARSWGLSARAQAVASAHGHSHNAE